MALVVAPTCANAGLFSAQNLISQTGATAVCIADVDQDGKPDVIAVSSTGTLFWCHGNGNGTFGLPQTLATGLSGAASVLAADMNSHGSLDIVVAGGNKIVCYPNMGGGVFGSVQTVAASTNGASKLFIADIDRDGKPDIVSASAGDGSVTWYHSNGAGTFTAHLISTLGAGSLSVCVADFDGDGSPDVACVSAGGTLAWWHNNGAGTFAAINTITASAVGAASIFAADLNRDGHPDLAIAGGNKVAWYPNLLNTTGSFGVEQVISTSLNGATSVVAAKINGTDFPDIVCASAGDNTISWFQNNGGNFGAGQVIASDATGAAAVVAADIDQDGDLDVVAASSGKVTWYSNQRIHRSASFPTRNVISSNVNYAYSVCAADLDGDGLPDAICASYLGDKITWYHNNGDGTFGSEQTISNPASNPWSIVAADVNGDGRIDIVAASVGDNHVTWYENQGGGVFVPHVIASGTGVVYFPVCVVAADMDGDGKIDIVSASLFDNKIAWYQNLGNNNFGSQQVISTSANAPWSVYVADMDGDGKPDVLSASLNDKKIAWYKNLGSGTFGLQQVISNTFAGAKVVSAADLDNDGLVDVLAASAQGDSLVWYKNLGGGGFSPVRTISQGQLGGANSIFVADVDRDGKPDVLATGFDFGHTSNKAAWIRNLGGGNFGLAQILPAPNTEFEPDTIYAGDIAGDGSVGIIYGSAAGHTMGSFSNQGGNFALATSNTASASMLEGQQQAVFRVDLSHRGIAGDDDVVLTALTLLFEQSAGVPLSNAQASGLIRSISIYADSTGTGTFDAARDSVVYKQSAPIFNNGNIVLDLSSADPNDFLVSYGSTRPFFVVVELTQNASSQSQNSFRVTNVTNQSGSVTGVDAEAGTPLSSEFAQNVSTPQVLIAADQAPASNGIASLSLPDTSGGSTVNLASAFSSTQPLTYTITGNTYPGLFDLAGIDSTNGLLVLNYHAGAKGSSQITITANDPSGKTATATFLAAANLINTIADWRTNRYGSPSTTAPNDLVNYAFALSPSGGNGPAMRLQNRTPVFSHLKQKYTTDLNYSYQISQDLAHWIPAVRGVHYFPYSLDNHDGTVSENLVLLTKWKSSFIRAKAQLASAVVENTATPSFPAIGNVTVLDPSTTTTRQLPDPQHVTYSITDDTNPNLFSSISIDANNGLLNLAYKPGAAGSSTLTVIGRNSVGKIVSTTNFTATVGKIQTLADWTSFYSGSIPPLNALQLLDYGLAINPTPPVGAGILPTLKLQDGSLVFSHLRPKFATDLAYQYQISSDLVHWIPAVNGIHYFDFSRDLMDGTRQVNLLILVNWPRAFLKAGVSLTP